MLKLLLCSGFLVTALPSLARAADYYDHKWFDFPDPDPLTAQWKVGCAKEFHHNIPDGFHHWRVHYKYVKYCPLPTHIKVAVLRHDVVFVVSGPSSPSEAVTNAVSEYALACVGVATSAAYTAAGGAGSATVGVGVVPAAMAAGETAFALCAASVSATGIVGAIVKQLQFGIDTSGTHMSPV